ncbi:MAG: DUF2155 domain-containing protein [Hyphomicrobiaceae bacterium]
MTCRPMMDQTCAARPPSRQSGVRAGGRVVTGLLAAALVAVSHGHAAAEVIQNEVAVFAALDKVTARISKLEVPLNQTVEFGSLRLTPRVCNARPPTEQPKTTTFVEVDEVELEGARHRIFTGWMFAESPGLNAIEHPVFDIWLTECRQPIGAAARTAKGSGATGTETGEPADGLPRRRVRR